VLQRKGSKTVQIPYTQAASPAELCPSMGEWDHQGSGLWQQHVEARSNRACGRATARGLLCSREAMEWTRAVWGRGHQDVYLHLLMQLALLPVRLVSTRVGTNSHCC
jgi:hypothetical protein